MIWSYLLLAYLLSGIGFLCYQVAVRRRGSSLQRKIFLLGILIGSTTLPFLFMSLQDAKDANQSASYTLLREEVFIQPEEPELLSCYNQALKEEEFCKCDELSQQSIISYREIPFFDNCMTCEEVISPIWIAIAVALLLMLCFQVGNLVRMILKADRETIILEGRSYTVLRTRGPFLAASFRLFKSYLIWQPILDTLPEEEQKAILYHEVGHLKHFDTWLQISFSLIQVLWFANPFFYMLRKEMLALNEFLADAFAIRKTEDRYAYAMMLVGIKERQSKGMLQFYASNPLKDRVERILDPEPRIRFFYPVMLAFLSLTFFMGQQVYQQMHQFQSHLAVYHSAQQSLKETGRTFFCGSCLIEETYREKPMAD